MLPNFYWLKSLKSAQLKSLATSIGINNCGNKGALADALASNLRTSVFAHRHDQGREHDNLRGSMAQGDQAIKSIISIDMGIKNLAYCRLHPTSKATITEWTRLDVSPNNTDGKDGYHPVRYAQQAYDLISKMVEQDPTVHFLIERQRFRSGGGSTVLEWTLKVNSLEAMLYAVLETLKREGKWMGNVQGVSPARVTAFWLGHYAGISQADPQRQENPTRNGKDTGKQRTKRRFRLWKCG